MGRICRALRTPQGRRGRLRPLLRHPLHPRTQLSPLPIAAAGSRRQGAPGRDPAAAMRSEEHTSELQSLRHLVCRLLLEKKKKTEYHNVKVTIAHARQLIAHNKSV